LGVVGFGLQKGAEHQQGKGHGHDRMQEIEEAFDRGMMLHWFAFRLLRSSR
jgi:hypothetical protein